MLLVTGITGLTGRFLYAQLKQTNLDVKYVVRKNSDISWMNSEDTVVYGELSKTEEIKESFAGVKEVLHLAPRDQLQSVLAACRATGIDRIYYVNSTGIYSKFKSSSHIDLKNEEMLKSSGLTYTIVRPSMIYGNHQDGNIHLLVKIMNKTPVFPVLGEGNGLMHPIYAQDLAKFLASVVMNEENTRFKEYDVAGKRPIKYKEVLENISSSLGKKVFFLHIPYSLALFAGKIGDKIPNRIINHEKVLRLVEDKNFDYSAAAEDLGFDPICFEEGIVLEIAELRKQGVV